MELGWGRREYKRVRERGEPESRVARGGRGGRDHRSSTRTGCRVGDAAVEETRAVQTLHLGLKKKL